MPKTTLPVSNELRETLRWATGRLWEICGPRLKRLILFGSQARGEAGPESDANVLVVLEGPTGAYEESKRGGKADQPGRDQGGSLSRHGPFFRPHR